MNLRLAVAPVLLSPLLAAIATAPIAEAQSCGELGGNHCSQDGYCPMGFNSLGDTYDPCSPCCQSGPSCGELGGDHCSQSGSCPAGYRFLGRTYEPCRSTSATGTGSIPRSPR